MSIQRQIRTSMPSRPHQPGYLRRRAWWLCSVSPPARGASTPARTIAGLENPGRRQHCVSHGEDVPAQHQTKALQMSSLVFQLIRRVLKPATYRTLTTSPACGRKPARALASPRSRPCPQRRQHGARTWLADRHPEHLRQWQHAPARAWRWKLKIPLDEPSKPRRWAGMQVSAPSDGTEEINLTRCSATTRKRR